jgi:hypothetical protein
VTSDTAPPAGTQTSRVGSTAPADPAAGAAPTAANTRNGEPRGWAETTRPIRWALALALVLAALAVFAYWLTAGTHLACQVVTVTTSASPATPAKTTTTQTCGLPDITDFIVVLAAVVLLLLPDAQKLKIGGFEFERLSNRIEEQTHEISQLRQTVSTTVNIGSDLINQARNGFRETKDILDRVRGFLPDTAEVRDQLAAMDQLESRIDAESWTDLFAGILTMHALIEAAQKASADALVRTSEAADNAESEAQSEQAESIISDYL